MAVAKYKGLTEQDMYKGVNKSYSNVKYAYGDGSDASTTERLTWYLVERTGATTDWSWTSDTDDMRNLFASFGLARNDTNDFYRFINSFDRINAKRMLIASIPQSGCGTYIDGSSVKLNVPIGTGATDFVTFYGSSYAGYLDRDNGVQVSNEYDDTIYGCASVYLFPDTNNPKSSGSCPATAYTSGEYYPYTGNINGSINPNSGRTSWDVDNQNAGLTWAQAGAKLTPHLRATAPARNPDEFYDQPYGLALLERGLFIIFDTYTSNRPDFIRNTDLGQAASSAWTCAEETFQPVTYTGGSSESNTNTANRKNVCFTGTYAHESAKLTYRTVDIDYKMIYFCHASMGEFNETDNPTYNHKLSYYREDDAGSIYITEIGLYDTSDNMVAYAKLSEPVEKSKLETLSFKVELQL